MEKIKGSITAPLGFKAAALHSGIKNRKLDLALIYSEEPAKAAGLFTTNRFKAAPVLLSMKNIKSNIHRAVILNSGNANCLTGKRGYTDALLMARRTASLVGCGADEVLVCSTGIIGKRLPIAKIDKALPKLCSALSKNNGSRAAEAIMTTDTFKKEVVYRFSVGKNEVRVAGIAKGAGMIEPNLATMLSVITTDAKIDKSELQKALKEAVEDSFNSITVDGAMSTNDTVLILANGLSGVDLGASKLAYDKFMHALNRVCSELAEMIVRDGEGATKFIKIEVKKAKTKEQAKEIGLAVANSNLFKTMCYGQNPNFGRVAAACGIFKDVVPSRTDIYLNRRKAVAGGMAVCDKLPQSIFEGKDINIRVDLNIGKAKASICTSDLSPKYVKINAEYS